MARRRKFRRPLAAIVLACTLAAASIAVASAGAAGDVLTGVIGTPIATPHPVLGADNRRHIAYELQLVNVSGSTVRVTRVRTFDADTDQLLSTLGPEAVAALMQPFGGAPGPTLGPGGAGFILLDISLPRIAQVPSRLVHELTVTYLPHQGFPPTERTGLTPVAHDAPPVIGAPLNGGRWVVVNGCCGSSSHREAVNPINGGLYVAERFAIDYVRLDGQGRIFHGDPLRLASWAGYGERVVSATAGQVVRTKDGIADNEPVGILPPLSLETVGGNYVVVAMGGGRFAFYAHLQPGSLMVHVGDRVRRGQLLGLLGNSGNSDFPHLHFHVMSSPSPLASDGLPHVLESFRSAGTLVNGDEVLGGGTAAFGPTLRGPFAGRLPMDLQVVSFGS